MTQQRGAHSRWNGEDADEMQRLLTVGLDIFAVLFTDREGFITGWSEACWVITGFTADEVIGRPLAIIFPPEDITRQMHEHELRSAAALGRVEDERWHMRKDGSRFWASGLTVALGLPDQVRGFAKLFRDATHLRYRFNSLENEVLALNRQQTDQAVFLATIAHELRNPLQPMTVATRLLSGQYDPTRFDQATKILDRQLGFMGRLVEDLVDMVRAGQGKMNLAYERVQLQTLLQEAVAGVREAAVTKGIALLTVFPPMPVTVEVDPGRFTQVIVNLLNNAIKFTPAGGNVSVWANLDQRHFMVKVQDSGVGIGPELQPRIFETFTQFEGAATGRGQGLGIGLALVKHIVSLHGGSVEVRSEGAGKGSEFMVRLPLAVSTLPPAMAPPPA